jgi:DNA polymerase III alpha subunit (gram-positive type)
MDRLQEVINDDQQMTRFITEIKVQIFPEELIKESIVAEPNLDLSLAMKLAKATLLCWSQKLEIIVSKFRPDGELYNAVTDPSLLNIVLNNNDLGESSVATLSRSIKRAANATPSFHQMFVKLQRNVLPPFKFIMEVETPDDRAHIRKNARMERINGSKAKQSMKQSIKSLTELESAIEQQNIVDQSNIDAMIDEEMDSERALIELSTISETDVPSMLISQLKRLLQAANAKVTGLKHELMFRLQRIISIRTMPQEVPAMLRAHAQVLMLNISRSDSQRNSQLMQQEIEDETSLQLEEQKSVLLVMFDSETCYSSSKHAISRMERDGGRQWYQWSMVPLNSIGYDCYARRSYITPVKGIAITAHDPQVQLAPSAVSATKARLRWERKQNADELIILYYARNEFDVYVDNDAMIEANVTRCHSIWYVNVMKLVKILMPGLKSYALENVYQKFGFGTYNAHDSFDDCVATWKVLLYALSATFGIENVLSEEDVNNYILNIMEDFYLGVPVRANEQDCSLSQQLELFDYSEDQDDDYVFEDDD